MSRLNLICVVAFGVVFLALGTPCALADEPPPDEFPPPAEKKKDEAPPKEEPEVDPEVPPDEKPAPPPKAEPAPWSPPAVTPGSPSGADVLPPPQVIRRGGSGRAAPRRSPPILDVTSERPAPLARRPVRTVPPSGTDAARDPVAPTPPPAFTPVRPLPRRPAPQPAPVAGRMIGTVHGVSKTHNVPLADGTLALRLDVDYTVQGQAGRDVYVGIWFARKDTGKVLRSALAEYADTNGNVTLQTRAARVRANSGRYLAALQIPYGAFPVTPGEASYDVVAQVQVLRADGGGRVRILCKGSTSFRVYGPPPAEEEPAEEEPAPDADADDTPEGEDG